MKIVEKQEDNHTIKIMIISHKFEKFKNIVCSGSKIYQLPSQIGKKSFPLKELKQKYHLGSKIYLINSKRISTKTLKKSALKVYDEFILEKKQLCPF